MPESPAPDCLVIGAGPAGLFAAGRIAMAGFRAAVFDRNKGAGRKFLVAGRGGLNLTHSEPLENFARRYLGGKETSWWRGLLEDFSPDDLRAWAAALGTETFVGTSGRVFPKEMSAGRLLAAWLRELRALGVRFHFGQTLLRLERRENGWLAVFRSGAGETDVTAPAALLALGGCSWPQTGSDGSWAPLARQLGLAVTPFQPANCGWRVKWPKPLLDAAEGLPLKNITAALPGAPEQAVAGDLVITKRGIEGGPVYRLGPGLRAMTAPALLLDLKPAWSAERISAVIGPERGGALSERLAKALRLSPAAAALLRFGPHAAGGGDRGLADLVKSFRLDLQGPEPLDRAISTAGGAAFDGLDDFLMARSLPGLFFAGEMLDWEAPTGGYLLQGCFSTSARAAAGVVRFLSSCGL